MDTNKIIREQLISLLDGGNAHMTFQEAVAQFPLDKINTIFPNGTYSAWHLLEHIRITQVDIINFITNENYKEIEWPKEYWPPKEKQADKKDWKKTIELYESDIQKLMNIVKDETTDLYTKIQWGNGQTIFREILLVADHTAYHLGEFASMREVMKTWGKSHV